jgi:hypothetical protein
MKYIKTYENNEFGGGPDFREGDYVKHIKIKNIFFAILRIHHNTNGWSYNLGKIENGKIIQDIDNYGRITFELEKHLIATTKEEKEQIELELDANKYNL